MRLILIRHGESEHSFRGIIAGRSSCPGLTPHGLHQAGLLADRLRATGELRDCSALFSSPVLRARQTAEVLAPTLPSRAIEQDCDLCELHPGQAEGLSWEAYRTTYGAFDLLTFPDRPFAPEAESWSQFASRVHDVLERLATRFAGQTVVVVTHAGFIVVSLLMLFAIPRPGSGARFDPTFTGLTEWQVTDGIWQLVRYNDAAHLARREQHL